MASAVSDTLPVPPSPTANRKNTHGKFETSSGTLYVSKPFQSSKNSKLKALITFTPRKSAFDTTNEHSGSNEFRGFFTLFWISLFLFTVRTYIRSIETEGHALNLRFATMFSQDAIVLAICDGILVLSTGISVIFSKMIANGWIRYYWLGAALQHAIQTSILAVTVTWTYHRQWPWVQSGFLTLHTFVMLMKMHSYMSTNGFLEYASRRSQQVLDSLRKATERVGGWAQAMSDAQSAREKLDAQTGRESTGSTPMGAGTPNIPEGSTASYVDADTALTLRKRLASVALEEKNLKRVPSEESIDDPHKVPTADVLQDHPDPHIASLAKEYAEWQAELTSSGPHPVTYPNNLTFKNFAIYQLIPTLVYELEYPRTESIRPIYIFEKCAAFFGSFALLYTIVETFILPLTPTSDQSFLRSLLDLALPFMISYILLFYIIFECICNAFAEISYFADRQFYEDWWNSTSWDEFSRKWNKPVHTFLLRHVYAATISTHQLSRGQAMFATFLLSACAHELVMVIVTQKIRMYLFLMQLIQIPLIMVSRVPIIKRNKLAGNIVFWLGLYAGFPLLCVAYCAY
ncbi:MBOAT, membrane-bound O-acyltransferase family-domain-containing protein [Flagelloscypha sp. PMI_526]|nr:MBOAT, membrane-bound O-acyltransferase family-domain-containing protein [Flagelloscypha sp. PMI_526]